MTGLYIQLQGCVGTFVMLHMLSAGTGETNQSKCEQDSRGHHLFGLYYYCCHGDMGSGSGVLATSWKLSWEE
jgi:hypothetical protein